jgi:hypothetical protein
MGSNIGGCHAASDLEAAEHTAEVVVVLRQHTLVGGKSKANHAVSLVCRAPQSPHCANGHQQIVNRAHQ